MNAIVIKNILQVSGLAGASLTVLFLFFRLIIRSIDFNGLKKNDAIKLVNRMISIFGVVAVVGISGWVGIALLNQSNAKPPVREQTMKNSEGGTQTIDSGPGKQTMDSSKYGKQTMSNGKDSSQ